MTFELALDDSEFAGLQTLSGGEIYFDDKPISKLGLKERDLAMLFQDYALYPHMTGTFYTGLRQIPYLAGKQGKQRWPTRN